ncbi:MAG TPA: DUF2235 domain-containing protein [Bradyrhizobium sp.]|jgi:uncharacterized protein (DUF2235 family)|nr:DUF2235 domain-containing protein [Bradyrhizobium sp.]
MAEPTIATQAKKRLAIFLDGTFNAVDDNTNVWRLKCVCAPKGGDNAEQLVYYAKGVNGFWGGVFGKGLDDVIRGAYEWLIDQYAPGDEVFIFGFSRGAYAARSLAGLITKCGLLKSGGAMGIKQLYARYQQNPDADTIWKLWEKGGVGKDVEERWLLKYSQPINIKLVAVWDTVGSLGVRFGHIAGISRSTFGWLHTGLRKPIENAFHAMAVDEHRFDFSPTLWTVRKPKDPNPKMADPRPLASVEQRWFVGAHANVGGGYQSDFLAQIPLRWMMKKASLHGMAFKNDIDLDEGALTADIYDSYADFMYGGYSKLSRHYYRPIGEAPRELEDGTHTNVNETIDVSVFDRYRTVSTYRPPGLVDWAKRYDVDPSTLRSSVRANEPQTAVPD